jgi:superfamily I DNA/RNA helicase/very-short-patch-repair endonuclease
MPSSQPADCRDAIHWFVNNVGLYTASSRGIFASDFSDELEPVIEAAIINLKSRGINPHVITGPQLYQQADTLWEEARQKTRFGRPVAGNVELEMGMSDLLVLKDIEAPEAAHHLWYLFHHVLYPRALSNKPVLITTSLGYDEFILYGAGCEDIEYAGRKITWEKVFWLIQAMTIDLHHFQQMKEEGLAPMLKAEYELYLGLKERGMPVHPQHVLGDYMLDIAGYDIPTRRRRDDDGPKLDIEVDVISTLDGSGSGAARRNLLLLNDGWQIVRFSTAEIKHDVSACVDTAMEVWQQGRKKSTAGRVLSGQVSTPMPELPVDDDVQRFAITHAGGPAAIEGGAGTGKSSCITHRVAHLLAQGISPEKILVLSHSNETLRPLKAGIEQLTDKQTAPRVNCYAWHDLGLKILKENLQAIKRKPPLKVESNPQKVIQRLLSKYKKELDPVMLELSEELDEFTIASLFSLYKANLITPKHLKDRCKSNVDELVAKVYQGYEDQLQKSNKIDRDDMISLAAHTLADNQEVRNKYQFQYEFILIDEFQEATAAADLLARLLAFPQDNLYIVGGEDEAIYESRGGLPRLISETSIKLPNARCYILEKNWRCHPAIVDHSRQLLNGLTMRRIQKEMTSGWGMPPTSGIIGPQMLASESAEAEWVAEEISLLIDGGRMPQDIAVLYRYHRYGLIIDESLSNRNIECVTTHPEAGMIPDEVGDVMAFLRLAMDPDGPKARESFERICQFRVKEVDAKLSATIASFAEANNLSYLKAIEIYADSVPDESCKELATLARIVRNMNQENLPPAQTISVLRRTQRLNEYYKSMKVPPGVNYEPLKKLSQLEEDASKYQTIAEFVKAQAASVKGGDEADQVVHILTLHEAKGKEFPIVFLVGLAEGLFPAESASDKEEERRLCYVGMTRAREMLYLSFPAIFNDVALLPSSFLIDARLMPHPSLQAAQQAAPPPAPAAPAPPQPVPGRPPVQAQTTQPARPAQPQPGTVPPPAPLPGRPSQQQAAAAAAQQAAAQQAVAQQAAAQRAAAERAAAEQAAQRAAAERAAAERAAAEQAAQRAAAERAAAERAAAEQAAQRAAAERAAAERAAAEQSAQRAAAERAAAERAAAEQAVQRAAAERAAAERAATEQAAQIVAAEQAAAERAAAEQSAQTAAERATEQAAAEQAAQSAAAELATARKAAAERAAVEHAAQKAAADQAAAQKAAVQKADAERVAAEQAAQKAAAERAAQQAAAQQQAAQSGFATAPNQVRPGAGTPAQPDLPPDWFAPDQKKPPSVPHPYPSQPISKAPRREEAPAAPVQPLPPEPAPGKLSDSLFSFAAAVGGVDTGAPNPTIPKPEPDLLAELLSADTPPDAHAVKRSAPQDQFWERKFKTPQPQGGDKASVSEKVEEPLDLNLDAAHAAGVAPPKHAPLSRQAWVPVPNSPAAQSMAPPSVQPPLAPVQSAQPVTGQQMPAQSKPQPVQPSLPPAIQQTPSPQPAPMQQQVPGPQHAPVDQFDPVEQIPPDHPAPIPVEALSASVAPQPIDAPPVVSPPVPSETEPEVAPPPTVPAPPVPPVQPPPPPEPSEPQSVSTAAPQALEEIAPEPEPELPLPKSSKSRKQKAAAAKEPPQPVDLDKIEFTTVAKAAPSPVVPPPLEPVDLDGISFATPSKAASSKSAEPSTEPVEKSAPPEPAIVVPPAEEMYMPAAAPEPVAETQPVVPAQPHYPATPISTPLCPGCTLPLEPGSRFCGECGYKLQVKIPACHLCGSPLEPAAKFCGECGSPSQSSAVDAEKPTQRKWVDQLSKLIDD